MDRKSDKAMNKNVGQTLLDRYWREISAYRRLSDEAEKALSKRILAGDEQAVGELVKGNLRFVVSIARGYSANPTTMMDLINEGNDVLVSMAKKFDATKGKRFAQTAVWNIRRAMEDFLKKYEVEKGSQDVTDPNFSKAFLSDKADVAYDDTLLREEIDLLPQREQMVLRACFGVGVPQMTMQEVGEKYGMTRYRVRQIRKRALRRLSTLKPDFG